MYSYMHLQPNYVSVEILTTGFNETFDNIVCISAKTMNAKKYFEKIINSKRVNCLYQTENGCYCMKNIKDQKVNTWFNYKYCLI